MNTAAWIVLAAFAVVAPLNWAGRWIWRDRLVGSGEASRVVWTPADRWDVITKPLATLLVIVLAAVVDAPDAARTWCLVALVLCLVGDVALLAVVDRFVVGLAAFLLGHLAFVGQMAVLGFDQVPWGVAAGAVLVVFGLTVGRRIIVGARRQDPALTVPVVAYLGVIASMAVVAFATGRPWALAGAVSFVVSDSVLGWGRFVQGRRWMPTAVMLTYHLALLSLTLSLV